MIETKTLIQFLRGLIADLENGNIFVRDARLQIEGFFDEELAEIYGAESEADDANSDSGKI